jgi:CRP-like cAMP-binding protein
MSSQRSVPRVENRILLSLPKSEYDRLAPDLEMVSLPLNKILFEACERIDCAYFINSGMVSLIAGSCSGGSIEIGMIGNEGILALPAIMGDEQTPYRSVVQIPGNALKITRNDLKRHFHKNGVFCDLILKFWQILCDQIVQSVVCNRFHTFEQRLCRWLLLTADRLQEDDLPLTHEFISLLLGANRATVTLTIGSLKKAGLIEHHRSSIRILDRESMEASACECYQICKKRLKDFLRIEKPKDRARTVASNRCT